MPLIFSYAKQHTKYTVIEMFLPDGSNELCTIDGVTYVSVPDGPLPDQPAELTVTPVILTPELKEQIKAASPHCQLIHERMEQKIRSKYSLSDEQYFARIGVGVALGLYEFQAGEQAELLEFGEFVEAARQWGRDERASLGLGDA